MNPEVHFQCHQPPLYIMPQDKATQNTEFVQVAKPKYKALLGRVLGIKSSNDGYPPHKLLAIMLRDYANQCTENSMPDVLQDLDFIQEYFSLENI